LHKFFINKKRPSFFYSSQTPTIIRPGTSFPSLPSLSNQFVMLMNWKSITPSHHHAD